MNESRDSHYFSQALNWPCRGILKYLSTSLAFGMVAFHAQAQVKVVQASPSAIATKILSQINSLPMQPPRTKSLEEIEQYEAFQRYQATSNDARDRLHAQFVNLLNDLTQQMDKQLKSWRFNEAEYLAASMSMLEINYRIDGKLVSEDANILARMIDTQRKTIADYLKTHGYSCYSERHIPGAPPTRPIDQLRCEMQQTVAATTFDANVYTEIVRKLEAISYQEKQKTCKEYASRYASQSFFERNPCWGWPLFHQRGHSCFDL